jgi:DNA-binding CsgD family transcriptional regulator
VVVTPLDDRTGGATAMVSVGDPADARSPNEGMLQVFYGLTAAEARVAARMATGDEGARIATDLGYTKQTLRWYCKQVLAKVGCRSRAELVRQLSGTLA